MTRDLFETKLRPKGPGPTVVEKPQTSLMKSWTVANSNDRICSIFVTVHRSAACWRNVASAAMLETRASGRVHAKMVEQTC